MQSSAHICVLGGGFGGLHTALRLAQRLRSCQITFVDPKPHFTFTPLLYEQFTGELETWEIAPTYASLLPHGVAIRRDSVQHLDLQRRQVQLRSGDPLSYDYLVLAVGQQIRQDAVPGVADHALYFRTLADSDRLAQQLHILTSTKNQPEIAIVGAGPNGVELACKLVDAYQAQVYLIDQGKTILKGFSASVQATASRSLSRRAIELKLETAVESVGANWIQIHQAESVTLAIDLVLWTTGTQPWDWVRSLPCQQTPQGQLRVRPTLQLLDYPEVFALGDVAFATDRHGQRLSPTAQVAVQQAITVADNLWARMKRRSLRSFHYQHQGDMLTLGMGEAVVSSPKLHLTGWLAHWLRLGVYLMRLPSWRHRQRVLWRRLQLLGRSKRSIAQTFSASEPLSPDVTPIPPSSQTRPSTRQ